MQYDPAIHHRRSIRLKGYDYSQAGAYFVTICAQNRECLFGEIVDGKMQWNEAGYIAAQSWQWLAEQYRQVTLDEWVVMPNHLHGILIIADDSRGGSRTAPTEHRKSLGRLIGAFKTVSTKRINGLHNTTGSTIWQRNYWEHVIRDEAELNSIREYIQNNPAQWQFDQLHVSNM
jgi:REP element-mobilizing transposase RayT